MTGGLEITLKDVYDAQQSTAAKTAEQIAGLSAKVGELSATVQLQLAAGQQRMDAHESKTDRIDERLRTVEQSPKVSRHDHDKAIERIDRLESFQGRLIGIGLTITVLVALIASAVGAIISHIVK